MMNKRALIFANGQLVDIQRAQNLVRPGDVLIAADGGTRHIKAMNLSPAVIIGDFDSIPIGFLENMQSTSPVLIHHPRDKEETDLELALVYARKQNFAPIIIIAALGGRLDQTIGNLLLLTAPEFVGKDIRLDDGVEEVFFTRQQAEWQGNQGDLVSLLPWGEPAGGVSSVGLKWPLDDEILKPDKTRGISNEMLGTTASVQIKSGLLLIIHTRLSGSQISHSR